MGFGQDAEGGHPGLPSCACLACRAKAQPAAAALPWPAEPCPPAPPLHGCAPQALQAGLAELRGWAAYVGGEWCCGAEEAEGAIERVTQAARYLVQVWGMRYCLYALLVGVMRWKGGRGRRCWEDMGRYILSGLAVSTQLPWPPTSRPLPCSPCPAPHRRMLGHSYTACTACTAGQGRLRAQGVPRGGHCGRPGPLLPRAQPAAGVRVCVCVRVSVYGCVCLSMCVHGMAAG